MDGLFGLIIGLLAVALGMYWGYKSSGAADAIKAEKAEKLTSYFSFDGGNNVFTIHKFHPDIGKYISMRRYEILHTGYQPETVSYTSVTVGNVTTGGVSKNDAYTYISGTSKTDKYKLEYLGKEIKAIRLGNDDVKNRAKQLGMEKYMNNNGDIIVVKDMPISRVAAQAALAGYYVSVNSSSV